MDYNRAINAAIIGHILTLIAIVLNAVNLYAGDRLFATLGVVAGVLTYAVSYFAESLSAQAVSIKRLMPLYTAAIPLCFLSYFFWLSSF